MSHHLFLPGVSWYNQEKNKNKNYQECLCREIGYTGSGGLGSPTMDKDQQ